MPGRQLPAEFERYSRQILFSGIGEEGQRRISQARVLVAGCGALGSALADTLCRAGVGLLRIVDRDFVELSNLQRQVLFDEDDIAQGLPKAVAAARKLEKINRGVRIEAIVADIDRGGILDLFAGIDVVVDGLDNFETRFLINDAALETRTPWIYAGCVGSHGQVMPVFPFESACLRCLLGEAPAAGATETCDTAGVVGPAVSVVAALEAVEALKIAAGHSELVSRMLTVVDVWEGTFRRMNVAGLREKSDCPACVQGRRDWLRGDRLSQSTVLCGRNAVQVTPSQKTSLSLSEVASRLAGAGAVSHNEYLLRLTLPGEQAQITLFPDGRAIIKGTDDVSAARALYARYVGV